MRLGHRTAAILLVLLLGFAATATGQVQWRVRKFGDMCHANQRIAIAVDDENFGPTLSRVIWVSPNRWAMAGWNANRVVVFDDNWKVVLRFGRAGGGPGEFRSTSDVTLLSDSTLAVSDPMQMRVHLFTHAGVYLRSFRTSRFPAHRIAGLPGKRIAGAGLSDIDSVLQFLAIYASDGTRELSTMDAPRPFASLTPRIDDAVLAARDDGSIVLVPAALDTVYQLNRGTTTKLGLAFPRGYWNQVQQVDHDGVPFATLKAKMNSFSYIFGGGLMNDSLLALGWRTGITETVEHALGMISLARRTGVLLEGAPGYLSGVHGSRIWMLVDQLPDSNIVQSFTCRVP